MRVLGVLLITVAVVVGGVATLLTAWRAAGAEVDYCPDGGCISAFAITSPALVLAGLVGWIGVALVRRRRP